MKITRTRRLAAISGLSLLAASSLSLVLGATAAFAGTQTASHGTAVATLVTTANSAIDASGFVSGQTPYDVLISGTGYTPTVAVQMIECPGVPTPGQPNTIADGSGCIGLTADTTAVANTSGKFTNHNYQVTTVAGQCDATHQCSLYIGQQVSDFNQPYVLAQFDIIPPPGMAQPPVLVTPYVPNPLVVQAGTLGHGNVLTGVTAKDSNGAAETVNPVSATPVVAPTKGSVTISPDGSFTYTPNTFPSTQVYPVTDTFTVAGPTATKAGDNPATSAAGNNAVVNLSISAPPAFPPLVTTITNAAASGATTLDLGNVRGIKAGDVLSITGLTGTYTVATVTPLVTSPNQSVTFTPGLSGPVTPGTQVSDATAQQTPAASTTTPQSLSQVLTIPLASGTLTMTQNPGTPNDILTNQSNAVDATNEPCGFAAGGSYTLTGQPFFACGALTPVTVVNATGTPAAWNVTATLTDFFDLNATVAQKTSGCDTSANFTRDCIPKGNLQWGPVAAVAHDLVPGDVGTVTAGAAQADIPYQATKACTQAGLTAVDCQNANVGGVAVGTIGNTAQAGWISSTATTNDAVAPATTWSTVGGNTLCTSPTNQSGGTYDCGANIEVAVPASVAADSTPFTATMTLTLV